MEQTAVSPPNIVWILGDQHRAQALGFMQDPNLTTPNIDRLAMNGWAATGAIANCPLCCPARGTLLTGKYAHNCVPGHEEQLPPEMPTIATAFKEAGYSTAYFGKWHLDGFKEKNGRAAMHIIPPERRGGFDEWVGYENNNSQWDCWVHGGEGDGAFHYRLPGYETDALTDLFIDYLRQQGTGGGEKEAATQPFFAVLSVQPPHDPYVAPEKWMNEHGAGRVQLRPNVPDVAHVTDKARRDLAGYYAMIENLDWNLGRVRAVLETADLTHNTHILFFSDHGDMHGSHGQFLKTSPWEEAVRVPFVIGGHKPRYKHRAGFEDVLLSAVDIAPTTLGLCGITPPSWMEGNDLSSFRLADKECVSRPDSAYLQLVVPTRHLHSIDRPWRGVVTDDGWKYVVLENQPWLLFNLREDPYERVNLAHNTKYGVERRRLQGRLAAWIEETADSFPLPFL
ncbi:MAG: sulfatase [Chloroflexota bacterium]